MAFSENLKFIKKVQSIFVFFFICEVSSLVLIFSQFNQIMILMLILFFSFLILFHKLVFTFTENLWRMNATFHNMLCESMEADLRILWWKHPYFFNMLRTCVGLSFYFWYAGRRSNIEYARPYCLQGVPFKTNSFPNHFARKV